MNLDVVATKLTQIADRIKTKKEPLEFLALCQRENSLFDLWDLVVCTPWLNASRRKSYKSVFDYIRPALDDKEMSKLSHIVIIHRGDAVLEFFLDTFAGRTGMFDVTYAVPNGAVIVREYVVLARR